MDAPFLFRPPHFIRTAAAAAVVLVLARPEVSVAAPAPSQLAHGDFWRRHALEELMPLWHRHGRDLEHGAFHLSLSREWQPQAPFTKSPAMISRNVFGWTAAFMLSGDERYLETAREGAEYVSKHAWDRDAGDWIDQLTQTGEPRLKTRTASNGLYTNVGLTLYYSATGDKEIRRRVMEAVQLRRQRTHDPEHGGHYQVLDPELNPLNRGKNKHAHYGYVGSLLLNLFLATRDAQVLQYSRELSALSLDRMRDDEGWLRGFGDAFDRQWRLEPKLLDGREVVAVGAQLTAALSLLRLYDQTGETRWLEEGRKLASMLLRFGFNRETGAWVDWIEAAPPHRVMPTATVSWWMQIYGSFLQLHLYRLTGDEGHLRQFERSAGFYLGHLIDREFGGVFNAVTLDGVPTGKQDKAGPWRSSYHEMEFGLLNYLYLRLFVEKQPAVLHYRIQEGGGTHSCAVVDDPRVRIAAVKLNGRVWRQFDAAACTVMLPPGQNLRLEVAFHVSDGP